MQRELPLLSLATCISSIAAAGLAAWRLATLLSYAGITTSRSIPDHIVVQRAGAAPLPVVEGPALYVLLAIPVLIALMPLVVRRSRMRAFGEVFAAIMLGTFVILGIASIGRFFIPAAVLSAATAALGWLEQRQREA